jgi:hypothetical protein
VEHLDGLVHQAIDEGAIYCLGLGDLRRTLQASLARRDLSVRPRLLHPGPPRAWRALATLIACPGHKGYEAMREIQRWRTLEKQLNALRCGPPGGESRQPGPAGRNSGGTP